MHIASGVNNCRTFGYLAMFAGLLCAETPPKQYVPAQRIVQQVIKDHPDVLVIAMHVTPPGGKENVIVASEFSTAPGKWEVQRIGKVADEDDLRVIKTGKPNLEMNKTGDRFEVEFAMKDAAGMIIGAVGVVWAYKNGDSKEGFQKRAEVIAAEIRRQTPTLKSLFDAPAK
jgi:hypothetical protein